MKKHGLWNGILKTRKFEKTRNFITEWNFKNTEVLKKTQNFIARNLKMDGVFENLCFLK